MAAFARSWRRECGRHAICEAALRRAEMPTWTLVIFALLMLTITARGFRNETWFYRLLTVLAAIIGVAIELFVSFFARDHTREVDGVEQLRPSVLNSPALPLASPAGALSERSR